MVSKWLLWALMSAAFAALTAILSKLGLRQVNPDLAQLIRTAVVMGAVVALNVGRTSWAEATALSPENWKYLILAGLATAASWVCYYRALAVGYASQVAVVDKLSVPLVAVAAIFVLGERLSPTAWLGVLLMFCGAALVAVNK